MWAATRWKKPCITCVTSCAASAPCRPAQADKAAALLPATARCIDRAGPTEQSIKEDEHARLFIDTCHGRPHPGIEPPVRFTGRADLPGFRDHHRRPEYRRPPAAAYRPCRTGGPH